MCLILNNLDCAVILSTRAIASSSSAELHWINTFAYFRKVKDIIIQIKIWIMWLQQFVVSFLHG